MKELLTDVSPELVEEFSQDFFAGRGRKILHDSKRWRVLDTWIGTPPELSRQAKSTASSKPEPLPILGQGQQMCGLVSCIGYHTSCHSVYADMHDMPDL